MAAATTSTNLDYSFHALDYVIVSAVLLITAIIGFYHVWRVTRYSKNTREFLVANRKLGLTPLLLSAAATALSSGTLLGAPMEAYSNGVQMMTGHLANVIGCSVAAFTTVPVLYRLNVSTTNQYVEFRFSRFLRVFPALVSWLQGSFLIATITYVTALVLTQATGLHIMLSTLIIAGLCIVYSALGGFVAVIWTDVFQMLVIFASYFVMFARGTVYSGGFSEIWEKNRLGNRTTFFYLAPSPISNYTAWSLVLCSFTFGFLIQATSQTSYQRQLACKTLRDAQKTVLGTVFIAKALTVVSVWIGMATYASYFDCDPFLAGRIDSRDQTSASFAMDIFRNIPGLSGLYVGGILCATLSTLSSIVNAIAAITLIDFIKPLMPKLSDTRCKVLSKIIGGIYGLLVFVISIFSDRFGNIMQIFQAIGGTSLGSCASIFIMGFFVPWVNTKGMTVGYLVSMSLGWILSINRILKGNPYTTAPMRTDGCPVNATTVAPLSAVPVMMDDVDQSLIDSVIPIWFVLITVAISVSVSLITSIIYGIDEVKKVDPELISPLTRWLICRLPSRTCEQLGVLHFKVADRKFVPPEHDAILVATEMNPLRQRADAAAVAMTTEHTEVSMTSNGIVK